MPRSKDVCAACSAPTARQPFVVFCGKCLRQFHCKCVGIKDEDHDLVVGTFKCFACTRRHDPESAAVLGGGTAGTPAVVRAPHHKPEVVSPTGDSDLLQVVRLLCRKVDAVAADVRSLKDDNASLLERFAEQDVEGQNLAVHSSKKGLLCQKIDGTSAELCPLNNANEVLCCQIATKDAAERLAPGGGGKGVVCVGQRDGACTSDDCELFQQVALLRRDVDALASDVRLLNNESELFRLHLARTTEVLGKIALGLEDRRPAPPLPCAATAASPKSYAAALRGDARHCVGGTVIEKPPSPTKELESKRSIATETSRELEGRRDTAALKGALPPRSSSTSSAAKNNAPFYKKPRGLPGGRRGRKLQSCVGTCPNSELLSAAPRRPARRALFVSRLHASTTSKSISDYVNGVTGGACVCTKLPSKHDTYASFHVAVDECDFEGLLKAELWPAGCLFRPFYGNIKEARCSDSQSVMIEKSK
ncbi:hypothetical protein HPB52_002364 [Rhipicephalus sanguineus]|uniref:PHD-type domain-containing protein n=2 Tax=Rhipicephalus sanguineus TaxID=34632 RepID=A0A9D4Q8P2_RHISA|nr:hypothetical protein HPB52_002364 [Rhipicephalus sanguineus]